MTSQHVAARPAGLLAVLAAAVLTACGGGGGDGAAPVAPALIDGDSAIVITRAVLDVGLGAGVVGAAVGGGGVFAADAGGGARALGLAGPADTGRAAPSVAVPAQSFDCEVSGSVLLSGSIAVAGTVAGGDFVNATFDGCDDGDGIVFDGGLRVAITAFSGDLFSDVFRLRAAVHMTNLGLAYPDASYAANGDFDLDLDQTVALVSDSTVSGSTLALSRDGVDWTLRDFAVTDLTDARGPAVVTRRSGTGTLSGPDIGGAVDFVTVEPFVATGDAWPAAGEILVTGAGGATVRATAGDDASLDLAIDLDGDGLVDETRQMAWAEVGSLGLVVYWLQPTPRDPVATP